MNFTIIGAGALGSILGAHLLAAGHGVVMVARGARAAQLRAHGLRVRGLRDFDLACQVVEAGAAITAPGVVIYTVKTYQMDEALAAHSTLVPQAVFSVANGVMKNEQLAGVYGAERVLGCMANVIPKIVATPFPPLKSAHIGKICPMTAAIPRTIMKLVLATSLSK